MNIYYSNDCIEFFKKIPILISVKKEINSLFRIPIHTIFHLILGVFYMEKNMQVFKCEFDLPNGKINHNVHADWDDQGNLHFCEHDLGEGVKEFWGTDEYEYFMMIHQKDVAKFVLCCLWKGFTFEERLSVSELRKLCDEYDIEYETDNWM